MSQELKRILRSAYTDIVLKQQQPAEAKAMLAGASPETIREAHKHLEHVRSVRDQCFVARTEAEFLSDALSTIGKTGGVVSSGRFKDGNINV